ncbi:MAG: MFS transporter [Methylobacillus sp.]|jgi:MFS family permease|nr:MFS transporter [Methylobacillus sp.]
MNQTTQTAQEKNDTHSQFRLLRRRRFLPLFITQFLGAFNDNAYKTSLVMLLTFGASWSVMNPEVLTNLAGGIFMVPAFLFSATAGQLADKFDKARLARWVKALEILIILAVAVGFWLHSLPWLLSALFLLGTHASFFGPIKYAILPQHLRPQELVGGNALVDAGTFIAILLGTISGGLLARLQSGEAWIVGICLLVALAGFVVSWKIPAAPAPMPELKISLNPLVEAWHCIGFARRERSVLLSILAVSWFWFYGATLLAQFPLYAKNVLGGDENAFTLLLAVLCVGISVGSLLCEKLTRRRGKNVEPGLVPMGALGMLIFGIDLYFASPVHPAEMGMPLATLLQQDGIWRVLFDLMMVGSFGGVYCVPLYALIQQRSDESCRARVIAANNILNALFMVLGALGAIAVLSWGHRTIPELFLLIAVMHAGVTIYIFSVVPEFLIRALIWFGWRKE